jgi:TonB family protein
MDAATVANVAAYCTQVAGIALLALVLPPALRVHAAGIRYACWRAALAVCLALPWLQTRRASPALPAAETAAAVVSSSTAAAATGLPPDAGLEWLSLVVLIGVAGIVARLAWVGVGFVRLHRLRQAGTKADERDYAELQRTMQTRADVRYVTEFQQPVTFGLRRPVVLLPAALQQQPRDIRDAVVAHELVHVRRHDWPWVVAEEIVRAVFWFHPALWWLISRVQLAREEVVDATVVAITGQRRAYVQALLAYADATPLAPAPAFARRHHLFRRIVLIAREDVMSARRIIASSVAMVAVITMGTWYVVRAFPLTETGTAGQLLAEAGPLEKSAKPITPENPVPRRTHMVRPTTPVEVTTSQATAIVTVRLTLDASGGVAEARVAAFTIRTPTSQVTSATVRSAGTAGKPPLDPNLRVLAERIVDAALEAARQWQYEPPFSAPIVLDTWMTFGGGQAVTVDVPPPPPPSPTPAPLARAAPGSLTGVPPPPPPPPGDVAEWSGIRVGGAIAPPIKIKDVRPVYPPAAQESRVQGVVILEVRIDPDGTVGRARVLRSIALLDAAALEAVRQWEFAPTLLNGTPTAVVMFVTVQFSLQ